MRMKRGIALFGLIGLIGCFLPLGLGISWFDLRELDSVVYLVMLAYAVPTVVGLTATSKLGVWAAAGAFGYIAVKFGLDSFTLFTHASIGGIMMGVGLVGGVVATI